MNTKTLRKESLTSTPITLHCETPVTINSEQLASPPSTPTISTPNVFNNAQQSTFGSCCCDC